MAAPSSLALLTLLLAASALHAAADYVLYTGEVLLAGQNLTNGPHQLAMQTNCDLVLYNSGQPAWRANTTGLGDNCYLGLKHTGELVVRRDVHYVLWSSTAKSKKGKYALVLNPNGRIAVYGQRRWTSNNPKELAQHAGKSAVGTEYVLYSGAGHRLSMGKKLKYRDYELGMKRCNLVIDSVQTGKVLWQTNTKANGCYLQLENNGELVLKHARNRLWSSNKRADSGFYIAVLRFDGRLAVYGPKVWTNERLDSYGATAVGLDAPEFSMAATD